MVFTRRNLDWWCERSILILVLTALIFAPLAFGAVYTWTFLVLQTLVGAVAFFWLLRIWGGYKPTLLWPPMAWVVVAFVLYAVVRYFTADVEYVARQELIRVLMYAFLLLAVISNLYDQESAEIISYTLTVVAVLASSYAIVQYLHHSNRVWNMLSPYPGRASGTYINPDHFAGFLELVLPLPLAFLLAGRVGVVPRLLFGYATLTILGGVIVTYSRGGWVAAAAGLLMLLGFLLCHGNHRLRAALVLLLFLVAGGVTKHIISNDPSYMRRISKIDDAGPGVLDFTARVEGWNAAAQMWKDHPWWGVGPGHFNTRFEQYRPEALQLQPDHVHCDYLELIADWGAAGGVIVLVGMGVFVFGLVTTWPHVRRAESDFGSAMSNRYAFFLGSVSGLFALALHSLLDFNLHIAANAFTGIVVLGLVASNLRFATKRYWVRIGLPLQCALTVVVVGFMTYFAVQMWESGGEMVWTSRADRMEAFSAGQAQALEKARTYEPKNDQASFNIGECYWAQSLNGADNYAELAQKAFDAFSQAIRLNPYDPVSWSRAGMCLDWLDRHQEAEKYYIQAEKFGPNDNFVVSDIGWHYVQIRDYAAARQWLTRANQLANWQNETAKTYLFDVCQPKLMDRASGRLPMILLNNGKGN